MKKQPISKGLSYDEDEMKPAPAPNVPDSTEFEKFDNAVRKMFTVSKADVLKEEAKWKRARPGRYGPRRNLLLELWPVCRAVLRDIERGEE